MPDATLTRLIMPTNLCRIGRPDKAFTPHPAIVHRCRIRPKGHQLNAPIIFNSSSSGTSLYDSTCRPGANNLA
ncbi:mannitol-1-phosphate 5-dehydrogenase [Escherichia coli TA249]|nr:hypothetical protein BMU01_27440 [Escherichia coli]OSL85482.1 mannitol-1-phosphate 5-dehydrogenase [Escherichia coli TA249]OUK90641.1 hypothetical protein BZL69_23845 [Escherichia coli]OUL01302.1 hypothetical protein BZL70_02965 [Escherichia coli]